MLFPRYWAKAASEASSPAGKRVPFAVWRWSESSLEEARALASEAADRIAARIRRGDPLPERYAYGDRPMREAVIREHRGDDGAVEVAVTRNSYGALILNTARIMFIDVDVPPPGGFERFVAGLMRLLSAGRAKPLADPAAGALARLREWVAGRPEWAVRVYRTRAGLRYLVTHRPFEPGSDEAEEAMEFLGSDPRYRKLCRVQKSFRARLTPKPWRCRVKLPPARFPFDDAEEERAMAAWEAKYAAACEDRATCAFLETVGAEAVHPEIEPVRALHDEMTRVGSGLRLA